MRSEARRHEQRLADYREGKDRSVARGADRPGHPDFGSFATLQLGLAMENAYARWCRWVADQLG